MIQAKGKTFELEMKKKKGASPMATSQGAAEATEEAGERRDHDERAEPLESAST